MMNSAKVTGRIFKTTIKHQKPKKGRRKYRNLHLKFAFL